MKQFLIKSEVLYIISCIWVIQMLPLAYGQDVINGRMMFSFNSPRQLSKLEFPSGAKAKIVKKGYDSFLEVVAPAGNEIWPGMYFNIPAGSEFRDWSSYGAISFDLKNLTDRDIDFGVDFFDTPGHYVCQNLVRVKAGEKKKIRMLLRDVVGGSRSVDIKRNKGQGLLLNQMSKFVIYVESPVKEVIFSVDNIKLERIIPKIIRFEAKPSKFSPNGDGWLDVTDIFAELSAPGRWKLSITDKKCNVVYSTDGKGSEVDVVWDGKDNKGKVCPSGNYKADLKIYGLGKLKKEVATKNLGIVLDRSLKIPEYTVWSVSSLDKVLRYDPAESYLLSSVNISAAGGETESFQIAIRPGSCDLKNVQLSVSDLIAGNGEVLKKSNVQLYKEHYVEMKRLSIPRPGVSKGTWWPDGLSPLPKTFNITRNTGNFAIWVDIEIPAGTAGGIYSGTISISAQNVKPTNVPFKIRVWDFSLPRTSSLETGIGLGYLLPKHKKQWKKYADLLLAHRLMPSVLPVSSLDELAEYAKDERVKRYRLPVPFCNWEKGPSKKDIENMAKMLGDARNRGDSFFKKHYIYVNDEPNPKQMSRYAKSYKSLKTLVSDAKFLLTDQPNSRLYGAVDIWCPYILTVDPELSKERQAVGEAYWWYPMLLPSYPYPSFQIDSDSVGVRIVPWMSFYWGFDGFLYWDASFENCSWAKLSPDIWAEPNENGDGVLIYPGDQIGQDKPMPSIRLKTLRDGMEDYEYFILLQKLIGKNPSKIPAKDEKIQKQLRNVISSFSEFKREPHDIEKMRNDIAGQIQKLHQKKEIVKSQAIGKK